MNSTHMNANTARSGTLGGDKMGVKEVREKWVKALRSGDYPQTRSTLRDDIGFCCLGVLCDIAMKEGIIPKTELRRYRYTDGKTYVMYGNVGEMNSSYLPYSVAQWAGLCNNNGAFGANNTSLARLNDEGKTFKEISDVIESNPGGLFCDEQTEDKKNSITPTTSTESTISEGA